METTKTKGVKMENKKIGITFNSDGTEMITADGTIYNLNETYQGEIISTSDFKEEGKDK